MSAPRPLPLLLIAALALTGCGRNTVTVYLNSSESEAPIRVPAISGPQESLTHAKQVRLTFSSAAVYLAGLLSRSPDPEAEIGWVEVLPEPLTIDLINLRGDQLRKLGEGTLPAANTLSQVRLQLQAPGEAVEGWHLLPGAVVGASDAECDLRIPAAAVSPGLTLPQSLSISGGGDDVALVISIRLDGATLVQDDAEGCTWEFEPVLYVRPLVEPTAET